MKAIFWICTGLLAYTYAGYSLWAWLRSRTRAVIVLKASIQPTVSIVIAVHNEASLIECKLQNLRALDYPADRCEIVIASDGSDDGTNELLLNRADDRVHAVICAGHQGKAAALSQALAVATGEIIVFTDIRQTLEPGAVRRLVSNFHDPAVGCVSGELMLSESNSSAVSKGLGLYWRLEKQLRHFEGQTGAVIGATGALYAVRRELLPALPAGTILDDVFIPMEVIRQGKHVVFEPEARAWDFADQASDREFRRKVRTLLGNYQLMRLSPWLMTRRNPVLFEFVSHKILRLVGPFLLVGMLVSTVLLPGLIYRFVLAIELLFCALATLAWMKIGVGLLRRVANLAYTFLMLNTAAMVAFIYFVTGKRRVWTR